MKRSSPWILITLWHAWTMTATVFGEEDLSQFLYLKENPEDVYPIQEYKAAAGSAKDETPAFLFSNDYPHARIVEFYAHWCPHCIHFKPKYIENARKLRDVMKKIPPGDQIVETWAISCVPNKDLCNQFDIHGYPMVKLFPAKSLNGTKLNFSELHPIKLLQQLNISTDTYSDQKEEGHVGVDADADADAAGSTGTGTGTSNLKSNHANNAKLVAVHSPHFLPRSKKELFEDAHLSLDFVMRHGIYAATNDKLPQAPKKALKEFLGLLVKALPTSSSLHPLASSLMTNHGGIALGDDKLQALMVDFPPPIQDWSPACRQHGTGYTCGLWTLFHILSVGTVEWNLLSVDDDHKVAPLGAADTIRNFIEHFFQCDECRAHFLSDYDSCGHDRCNRLVDDKTHATVQQWREFPLWLYETHNSVNTRLRSERLANQEPEDTTTEWQVQWPPVAGCPNCWLSEGRWDEEQVYRYLRLQYWPEDYNTEGLRNQLHHSDNDYLHPDVVAARRTGGKRMIRDPAVLQAPTPPSLPLAGIIALLVTGGYAWHRKRRYDMKGYHKKRESLDC